MIGEAKLSLPPSPLSTTEGERDIGKLKRATEGLESHGLNREEQEKRLKKACDQFETILVKMVLKSMRDATPREGLFGSGLDQDIYTSMMDDALAESIASGRSLGISRAMFEQMKNRMEPAPAEAGRQGEVTDNVSEKATKGVSVINNPPHPNPLPPGERGYFEPKFPLPSTGGGKGVGETGSLPTSSKFTPPLEGRLSSDFGWRKDPFTAEKRFHKGIDLAAPRGTPVLSSAEGKVVFSGWQRGHGNTVVIQHPDGYETRYSHNAQNIVQAGDQVTRGQMIARVGDTGRSTGPHLHFEVKKGGVAVDPTEILV